MPRLSPNCRLPLTAAATMFSREAYNPLFYIQKATNAHIPSSTESSSSFSDACKLFDEMYDLGVVSATSIIGTFSKKQQHKEAIYLFTRMLSNNIRPTEFTFGTVMHSSSLLKDLNIGKQLHACTIKMGLNSNVFVGSASLDLYSKLSTIEEANRVFEDTRQPNVVSYTTLISGYLKNERFEDALWLFKVMPERNVVSWNAMISGFSQTGFNEEAVNLFIQIVVTGFRPGTKY
ncbi:Pentatricopeptide repeat-containing protein [Hibiscus syriacus]|uniref:Pentatricopeptide repeat-containing protein n=1 Tax=Hibiscus syriacus TaxID=106335 RepID=A0A6A3CRI2_HIBSY|nr:Pentatricopeptide repeat-containing protein [Hibiscus syriacus]